MANSICDLSNPMLSISATAAARSAPIARPVVPKPVAGVEAAGVEEPAPAGVGVAGTGAAVENAGWDGAAGGAGVEVTAGAGVDGGFADAGAAFGYKQSVLREFGAHHGNLPSRPCRR